MPVCPLGGPGVRGFSSKFHALIFITPGGGGDPMIDYCRFVFCVYCGSLVGELSVLVRDGRAGIYRLREWCKLHVYFCH